ncbi:MAG: hypothetical protein KY443_04885 [Actinobacteria bacterium]|nr:hypothetical protein [Actinomycetota bacterium]
MFLDLLKSEQERVARDIGKAEAQVTACQSNFGDIADTLDKTLALLVNCQDAYRRTKPQTRRELNQFFFERLLVHDDAVDECEPTTVPASLRRSDLRQQWRPKQKPWSAFRRPRFEHECFRGPNWTE